MKAAVTSYVICVVRNFESSEQYLSAKYAITWPPTVNKDSGSVKGIGTTFGMAVGILLSISVAILTKKVLNFWATSVGFDMILPSMFK